jgi:hypothetical protein
MDPAPGGPSSGALALAALTSDAVASRVLSRLDAGARKHLRLASKDLRDACDRQVKKLSLPTDPSFIVTALPCLYRLVQRGVQLEKLCLGGLTKAPSMPDAGLEALL